jgi:hypothetical protein
MTWLDWLLGTLFMPHGHCILWTPWLLWPRVIADAVIAGSYYAIPLGMASYLRRKVTVSFRWLVWLYVGFIALCGTTHVFDVITIWWPIYVADTLVRVATAAVSVTTACLVAIYLPKFLESPTAADLQVRLDQQRSVVEELATKVGESELPRVRELLAELRAEHRGEG